MPLSVDILIRNSVSFQQCTRKKCKTTKPTSYSLPQLRWDKADRASYYYYTGLYLQPVLSFVEDT